MELDSVDEAILGVINRKKVTNLEQFTADDLFYLSVSRNAQNLSSQSKLRLQQQVLAALSNEMNNNSD